MALRGTQTILPNNAGCDASVGELRPRLFLLDMLLGNADRLPCEALSWRGNAHNALFCPTGPAAGRLVTIDSAVQRRPPGETWLPTAPLKGLTHAFLPSLYKAQVVLHPSLTVR